MESNAKQSKLTIDMLLASAIILWLNAGFFTAVQTRTTGIVMYSCMFIWFAFAFLYDSYFIGKVAKRLVLSLIPIALSKIVGNSDRNVMVVIYVFFLVCIKDYYIQYSSKSKFLFRVWLIDTAAVTLNTIRIAIQNPMIVREMSVQSTAFQSSAANVCASFGNILCYVALALILFYKIITKKSNSFMFIGFFILSTVIVMSQIAILISAFVMGMALIVVISTYDTPFKFFLIGIPICVLLAAVIFNLPEILSAISKMSFLSDMFKSKIQDAVQVLRGTSYNAIESQERFDRYQMSINSFLRNPLIGTVGQEGGIGGHSTWFDSLGMYGILSSAIFFWHYMLMKDFVSFAEQEEKKYYTCIAVVFTLIGFADPILFHNAYILFVMVIPLAKASKKEGMLQKKSIE